MRRRMKSPIGSTAYSRTSSAGVTASCTAFGASTWTGSSSNGRFPMELAAARRKLLRAAGRGPRVRPDNLEGHRRHRNLTGRKHCACIRSSPPGVLPVSSKSGRKSPQTAGLRSIQPDSRAESPGPAKINMLCCKHKTISRPKYFGHNHSRTRRPRIKGIFTRQTNSAIAQI